MAATERVSITWADSADVEMLQALDHHLGADLLAQKIIRKEVIVARVGRELAGWLRYGYFWDNIPFMNLLFVLEPHRGQGIARQLIGYWEDAMRTLGYEQVLTSTLADESAQHLYRKLGYTDCGALFLPAEAAQIFLRKLL